MSTPFSIFKEDWGGESIKEKNSPRSDPYVVARYKSSIDDAKRLRTDQEHLRIRALGERKLLERGTRRGTSARLLETASAALRTDRLTFA
jgi:hypothetical protein